MIHLKTQKVVVHQTRHSGYLVQPVCINMYIFLLQKRAHKVFFNPFKRLQEFYVSFKSLQYKLSLNIKYICPSRPGPIQTFRWLLDTNRQTDIQTKKQTDKGNKCKKVNQGYPKKT